MFVINSRLVERLCQIAALISLALQQKRPTKSRSLRSLRATLRSVL